MNDKILSTLGLAKKAGMISSGTNFVSTFIRSDKKPSLVLLAEEASDNTKKLIEGSCRHHKVPCRLVSYSMDELSHAIGASYYISCVAIFDRGFASTIEEKLDEKQENLASQGV